MTPRDALEKEANDHAMEHACRTLYYKASKRDDFVAGYLQAATASDKEIEALRAELADWHESAERAAGESCGDEQHCTCVGALRARIKELEGYLSKAQVALVYFTRVRGDRILDRDCNWLMLDSDMKEAIINAHNKEHND